MNMPGPTTARIVRRIAEDPTLPTEPIAERFPAAVFFADISGFTQMAERLGQSGPSGAEQLRRLINFPISQSGLQLGYD